MKKEEEEKAPLRRNLYCHILRTECRKKLKFGEVIVFIFVKIFREKNKQTLFRPESPSKLNVSIV